MTEDATREPTDIERLAELIRAYSPVVALTGAGISTESGIPDFRSPGGLYESVDPMEYLSVSALEQRPARFWGMFAKVFAPAQTCEPNAGHIALARLENAGLLRSVITQNIDGLHQKAGSKRVIEVHGHLRTVRCMNCGTQATLADAVAQIERGRETPGCAKCGEMLRPDVVLFGDMLDEFEHASQEAGGADLTLVVGSSLAVSPANTLAGRTRHLAIVNRDATHMDYQADVVIHAGAGETLGRVADILLGGD